MGTEIPLGVMSLLEFGDLPEPALTAAAGDPELLVHLCNRDDLPTRTIIRAFAPGRLPAAEVATRLVCRRLPQAAVAHIVGPAGERRPEVLRKLVWDNVPAASPRRQLLADAADDPGMVDGILANRRWPVTEQFELLHRADGHTMLEWLAHLDPEVEVAWSDVLGTRGPVDPNADDEGAATAATPGPASPPSGAALPWLLDSDPVLALHALLRRPWLAEVPLELAGTGLRSAIATVSADERVLYRLLGTAERLAVYGQRSRAAQIIEAVACNPSAPLGVQRRARRLTHRIPCPYLDGWFPARGVDGPVWETDLAGQHRAMDRIEQLQRLRHRTLWSAALLARNPDLAPGVADRIVRFLDDHLHAVDEDKSIAALVGTWLHLDRATLQRWEERPRVPRIRACPRPITVGRNWSDADLRIPAVPHLHHCQHQEAARRLGRRLARRLGNDLATWEVAWLLLRDGWELPLFDLPAIVRQLHPDRTDHAA